MEQQLEVANDIIHFVEKLGWSSKAMQLKRDFTTPTRKYIARNKAKEERQQADRDSEARIAAHVARVVAPRTRPLDTLAHIDAILNIRQSPSATSAAASTAPLYTPTARRQGNHKVFLGVILPLTVDGKRVGEKHHRVESSDNQSGGKRIKLEVE